MPVIQEPTTEEKAPNVIIPSTPSGMIPHRLANMLARDARSSGVDIRSVALNVISKS